MGKERYKMTGRLFITRYEKNNLNNSFLNTFIKIIIKIIVIYVYTEYWLFRISTTYLFSEM